LSGSELMLRVSFLNFYSKIATSTKTSPYKCSSLMHIVLCTFIVSVRPIQMSHSHAGVPRTTTQMAGNITGLNVGVPRTTTTTWQETSMHRIVWRMRRWYITKITNLYFHGNYVKDRRTLIIKYNIILVNDQLDALFLNVFILCLYMFRSWSARQSPPRVCYTRWCINTIWPSWWWELAARNM
jgi:hypothetical protein